MQKCHNPINTSTLAIMSEKATQCTQCYSGCVFRDSVLRATQLAAERQSVSPFV